MSTEVDLGLRLLSTSKESSASSISAADSVDIVTVHGLGGHRTDTWADAPGNDPWLSTLLPDRAPGARIMAFGYDTLNAPGVITSAAALQSTAVQLLDDLVRIRKENNDTAPIVFLCHSFGGIIVKQLLCIANSTQRYASIAAYTECLIFFGTPHQETSGKDSPSWDDMIFDMALASPKKDRHTRRDISAAIIKTGSHAVVEVSERFITIAGQYSIVSVYESLESLESAEEVVPKAAATLRAKDETMIHRPVRHLDLCRISKKEVEKTEAGNLQIIFQKIKEIGSSFTQARHKEYIECRKAFCTLSPAFSPRRVTMPHAGTLKWLDSNSKFSEWVENKERTLSVLTVYGQSGSGKTTLGHHLVHHLRERLMKNEPVTRPTIISYYFDELDARRRSYKDFLLSLLRQLLFQGQYVYHLVETLYKNEARGPQPSKWTHEDLWIVVRSIIACEQQQNAPFICVVDGLDECGETKGKLLSAVRQLHGRTEFDVRFAFFTQRGGGQGQDDEQQFVKFIDLDEEEGLKRDRILVEQGLPKAPEALIRKWDSIQMSKTTFLETALLMNHHSEFPYLLEEPPPYLPKIYDIVMKPPDPSILTAEPPEDHMLKLALPWITYSCCPLTIGQLAMAITLTSNPKPLSFLEGQIKKESLRRTLDNKLGRLLQVTEDRVCFVHRNIRDMFSEKAVQKTAGEVHADLAEACLSFLCMEELANLDTLGVNIDSYPWLKVPNSPPECSEFLLYAARYWPEHYRESMESSDSRSDGLFNRLKRFFSNETRVKWWSEVWPLFDDPLCLPPHTEVNSSNTTSEIEGDWRDLLGAASRLGLATVVSRLLKLEDLNSNGGVTRMFEALKLGAGSGWSSVVQAVIDVGSAPDATTSINDIDALKIACEKGHESVVGLLLKRRAKSKQDPTAGTASSPPPEREENEPSTEKTSSSTTVLGDCLCLASEHGHLHVVQQLLDAGASASYLSTTSRRPHLLAASNGYDLVLRKLLDKGADPAALGADGRTALQLAAMGGHLEAFRVLDPAEKPDDYPTLLDLAARNGRLPIIKDLMMMGCNLEGQPNCSTALHVAAENGHVIVVTELLKAGVNPSPIDGNRKTPLHLAASSGHLEVAEQLLSGGAEPDPIDAQGRTPLADAIISDRPGIAEKLLEFGAAVGSSTTMFGLKVPLLHYASYYPKPECVKVLLENGASPNKWCTVSGFGECTAIHLAYDDTRVLGLLLAGGADANVKDSYGRTVLYCSVVFGHTASVETLLAEKDGKVNAMIPQRDGLTALHAAIAHHHGSVVDPLIKRFPDLVTASNRYGQTPLFYAARMGGESLVKSLLEAPGADIFLRDHGGWMPIQWAVKVGGLSFINHQIAEYLRSTDPEKGLADKERKFLLALAASKGGLEVVNLLLDKDFKVNEYDAHYGSALQAAAQNGHVKIVERLMTVGADPTQKDDHGWSPTLCAARLKSHELLQLLYKSVGADSSPGLEESENAKADTSPPTAWSGNNSRNISLAEDGKVARNTLPEPAGSASSDVDPPTPVVRANHPLPARRENSGCYFEITITNAGKLGSIEIGVDDGFGNLGSPPGLDVHYSWCYMSDGSLRPREFRSNYGNPESKFGTGDVIGCGINKSGDLFFTKNGQDLGPAYYNLGACRLFPVVCLASPGADIRADFSKTWPPDTTATAPEHTESERREEPTN